VTTYTQGHADAALLHGSQQPQVRNRAATVKRQLFRLDSLNVEVAAPMTTGRKD